MISRLYQKWCGLTDNLAQRVPFHYGIILSMLALMLIVGVAIVSFWLSHHLLEQNKQFTQGSFDVAQNSDEMRMQFFQWQEHTATVGSQKTSPEQQLLTKTMAEALFISIGNELAWYADHPDEGADYTAQLQEIAALFSQLQQLQINMMARLPANRTHHTIAKMIEDKITTGTEMELLISGLQQQQLYSIQQSIEEVETKQDLILWIGGGVVLLFSLLGTILLTLVHRATYLHIQSSLDVINTWAHGSFHTRVVSASLLAHAPPDHGGTLFASKYPFSALAHHINHLGDLVQVFLLETRSSLEAMAAGNTERRIQHEGFPWQLKKIAVDINANIDHVVDIYMKADADQANLDEFQRDLGIISQSLGAVADSMGMNGMELADASQLMETRVQTTEQEAGRVQQSMGQASQAVDAISESISEVAGQVREASAITSEAVEQAQETRAAIAQLEQASGNIGNMVELITTIARQTQMLSMNATIEAARAGDAGRGFAVVASEVKALATQTSGAAQDISASIEEIQSTTHAAMQVIQTVAETIERIHAITKDIERNAEQQEHSAKGIASNVTQANRATTVMGENLTEVRTAADTTNSNVETVNTATEELRQSIDELDKIVTNYIGEAEPDDIELF